MKPFLLLPLFPGVFFLASATASDCRAPVYRNTPVYRTPVYHEPEYYPVALADLLETYFTFPTLTVQLAQPQVQAQSQIQTQPQIQPQPQSQPVQQLSGPPPAIYQDAGGSDAGVKVERGDGDKTSLFTQHCASCHSGPSPRGNFQLFSSPGQLNPQADLAEAWLRIKKGEMPPGRPLDPSTQSRFRSLILR